MIQDTIVSAAAAVLSAGRSGALPDQASVGWCALSEPRRLQAFGASCSSTPISFKVPRTMPPSEAYTHTTAFSPASTSTTFHETSPLLTRAGSTSHSPPNPASSRPRSPRAVAPVDSARRSRWYDPSPAVTLLKPLRLENTGSVARDHLANERTFLAWLRTSLAFCSVGVALTQLFSLSSSPLAQTQPSLSPLPPFSSALQLSSLTQWSEQDVQAVVALVLDAQRTLASSGGDSPTGVGTTMLDRGGGGKGNARLAQPLGGGLIGTGLLILLIGLYRYFSVQNALVRDQYPATRLPVLAVSLLSGAFVVAVLGVALVA